MQVDEEGRRSCAPSSNTPPAICAVYKPDMPARSVRVHLYASPCVLLPMVVEAGGNFENLLWGHGSLQVGKTDVWEMFMGSSGSHLYTESWVQILEAEQGRSAACCYKAQECLLLIWCEALQSLHPQ